MLLLLLINGVNAIYHTGNEVRLSPGFSSIYGSDFHAYMQGCSGTYYRMSNSNDETEPEENNSSQQIMFSSPKPQVDFSGTRQISPEKANLELKVIPNPSNGNFKLVLLNAEQYPTLGSITDIFGNKVSEKNSPESYQIEFNISDAPKGMYIVKLIYKDELYTRKIIKN